MEKNSSTGSDDQNGAVGSSVEKTTEERPQEESTTANTPAKTAVQAEPSTEVISTDTASSSAIASPNVATATVLNESVPAEELATASGTVKNPAAVSLGRLGGLKGGKARAQALTKRERSEAARKAARARWRKKEQTK